MVGISKKIFGFTTLWAVAILLCGLLVGCSKDGGSSSGRVDPLEDGATVAFRIGIDLDKDVTAKGLSGVDVGGYLISIYNANGKKLEQHKFWKTSSTNVKAWKLVEASGETPAYRECIFYSSNIDADLTAHIDYLDYGGNVVAFGNIKDFKFVENDVNTFSCLNRSDDAYDMHLASEEKELAELIIKTDDETTMAVGDTYSFRIMYSCEGVLVNVTNDAKVTNSNSTAVRLESFLEDGTTSGEKYYQATALARGYSEIKASYRQLVANVCLSVDPQPTEPSISFKDASYNPITSLHVPCAGASFNVAYKDSTGAISNLKRDDANLTLTWDHPEFATLAADAFRFEWVAKNTEVVELTVTYKESESAEPVEAKLPITTSLQPVLKILDTDGNVISNYAAWPVTIPVDGYTFQVQYTDEYGETSIITDATCDWPSENEAYATLEDNTFTWVAYTDTEMLLTVSKKYCDDVYVEFVTENDIAEYVVIPEKAIDANYDLVDIKLENGLLYMKQDSWTFWLQVPVTDFKENKLSCPLEVGSEVTIIPVGVMEDGSLVDLTDDKEAAATITLNEHFDIDGFKVTGKSLCTGVTLSGTCTNSAGTELTASNDTVTFSVEEPVP